MTVVKVIRKVRGIRLISQEKNGKAIRLEKEVKEVKKKSEK